MSIFDHYRLFKDAPEGFLKKIVLNQYAHFEQSGDLFYEMTNINAMSSRVNSLFNMDRVLITLELYSTMLIASFCQLKDVIENRTEIRILKTIIFPEEKYKLGSIRNARLRYTNYGKFMKRQSGLLSEGGFITIIRNTMKEGAMKEFAATVSQNSARECSRGSYPDPEFSTGAASLKNYYSLWTVFFIGLTAASMVNVAEILLSKKRMMASVKKKDTLKVGKQCHFN